MADLYSAAEPNAWGAYEIRRIWWKALRPPASPRGSAEDLHTIYVVSVADLHTAAMELDIGSRAGRPAGG